MPALWVGNLDFEEQLQGQLHPSKSVRRHIAELTPCLVAVMQPGDYLLCPLTVPQSFQSYCEDTGCSDRKMLDLRSFDQIAEMIDDIDEIQPWGWSPSIAVIANLLGIADRGPTAEHVSQANSRAFSFALSQQLDCGLDGEVEIRSIQELESAVSNRAFSNGCVVKLEFGQSGRGQIISRNAKLDTREINWIRNRLARKTRPGERLFLEPKLNSLAEFGIQWDLPVDGEPRLHGITQLQSSARGQYVSTIVRPDISEWQSQLDEILRFQEKAVREVQSLGYFGPVGIDAMIYQDRSGDRRLRPLQDINARWTMGRLAIKWADICFPHQDRVFWVHSTERPTPDAICTSSETVGGEPVKHRTWCHR